MTNAQVRGFRQWKMMVWPLPFLRELDEVLAGMKPDSAMAPTAFFKAFWRMLTGPLLEIISNFGLGHVDVSSYTDPQGDWC